MAGLNRAKIAEKLYHQLDKKDLLKEIIIYRQQKSAYKEKLSPLYVCTLKAYYHKDDMKINIIAEESATTNRGYEDKLLVVYGAESIKIAKDDFFMLGKIQYRILELGNIEDIIFDMSLDRM